ncbi:UvrD-helicase domain-containing protein [Peribacillus tepidiphilus]|uniref:UvrD-helicase domain-containing protein n=1 Tax=Peribacillus tepidiphilus TaxID=2652445 RepID=UPI001CDBC1BC|nr:UvrD-helicase domain-containing protein [Peribacillus tepidiphilus]
MFSVSALKEIQEFIATHTNLEPLVESWNSEFISNELTRTQQFLDDIDGKLLDEHQRTAIIVDEDDNLIVAGAGAGKTLTISDKVKYLVEELGIAPEEILLVS